MQAYEGLLHAGAASVLTMQSGGKREDARRMELVDASPSEFFAPHQPG
jgi:hypothetical protein